MPGYSPASIRFFSPSPGGPPAMSTNVGSQSRAANSWFLTVPGLMWPGQRGRTVTAFPGFSLLALERCYTAVRKADGLGPIVSGEHDDGVVELTHVFKLLEDIADIVVHL